MYDVCMICMCICICICICICMHVNTYIYLQVVEARGLFQQGVWGASSSGKVHNLWQAWGQMEAKQGNIEDARKYLARAVDAADRPGTALLAWAMVEERQGAVATSAQVFRGKASCLSPSPSLASCLPPLCREALWLACPRSCACVCGSSV